MTRRRSNKTNSGSSQKSGAKILYCTCESSDDKGFMIACDFCDKWYHGDCVGVTLEQANNIKLYLCDLCLDKEIRARRPNLRQQKKKTNFSSDDKENDADLSNSRLDLGSARRAPHVLFQASGFLSSATENRNISFVTNSRSREVLFRVKTEKVDPVDLVVGEPFSLTDKPDIGTSTIIPQDRAEQEEEYISNTALNYEQEEFLTNDLTRKLSQPRDEKANLEKTLEKEQEAQISTNPNNESDEQSQCTDEEIDTVLSSMEVEGNHISLVRAYIGRLREEVTQLRDMVRNTNLEREEKKKEENKLRKGLQAEIERCQEICRNLNEILVSSLESDEERKKEKGPMRQNVSSSGQTPCDLVDQAFSNDSQPQLNGQ